MLWNVLPSRPDVSLRPVVHICPLASAGVQVFIIGCCLSYGIEFLHLYPCSLSFGSLSVTLYLLHHTSLTLSSCDTSTYPSPPLPSPLPTFPPHPSSQVNPSPVALGLFHRYLLFPWCLIKGLVLCEIRLTDVMCPQPLNEFEK